jgi:SAM-dependent methyltransferase
VFRILAALSVSLSAAHLAHEPNLDVPAAEYRSELGRGLKAYKLFFDERRASGRFSERLARLGKDDLFVDSGAGFGLAAIELAREKGVQAVAISAHDFEAELRRLESGLSRSDLKLDAAGESIVRLGSIDRWGLDSLIADSGLEPLPSGAQADPLAAVKARLHGINAARAELRRAGSFKYVVGLSQEVLPGLEGRVALLTDAYGAFFYSTDRARLLEQFYDALAPGGEAFVLVGPEHGSDEEHGGNRARDYVRARGRRVELLEYLVARHPDVFELGRTREAGEVQFLSLVIRKRKGRPALRLGLELASEGRLFQGEPGYEFQTGVEYKTKR